MKNAGYYFSSSKSKGKPAQDNQRPFAISGQNLNQISEKSSQDYQGSLVVAGLNDFNQISEESNNMTNIKIKLVSPPLKSDLPIRDLLCFSTYFSYSIKIDKYGTTSFIGSNTDGGPLKKNQSKKVTGWTDFDFKSKSAVCGNNYILFLMEGGQLGCFWSGINKGSLFYINTQNLIPVSLYGGRKSAAAIGQKGEIMLVTQQVAKSRAHVAEIVILPHNERAIFVACLEKGNFFLSETGAVYGYSMSEKKLKPCKELSDEKIVLISGTFKHCLALTEDGRVYGQGSNSFGQLCKDIKNRLDVFTELTEIGREEIKFVSAGSDHSLFINKKGKVFSCGKNINGELMMEKGPSDSFEEEPVETAINKGAEFCIAGCQLSCVYVCSPPIFTSNQVIKDFSLFGNGENNKDDDIVYDNDEEDEEDMDDDNDNDNDDDTMNIKPPVKNFPKPKPVQEEKNEITNQIKLKYHNITKKIGDINKKICLLKAENNETLKKLQNLNDLIDEMSIQVDSDDEEPPIQFQKAKKTKYTRNKLYIEEEEEDILEQHKIYKNKKTGLNSNNGNKTHTVNYLRRPNNNLSVSAPNNNLPGKLQIVRKKTSKTADDVIDTIKITKKK